MKYFGTDGFRGDADAVMTPDISCRIGLILGKMATDDYEDPCILIARDTRESGPRIEEAVAKGIRASGTEVSFMGVAPTAALSYAVRTDRYIYGVMVTASHNPYRDNGIKIFDKNGEKLDRPILKKIERALLDYEANPPSFSDSSIECVGNGEELLSSYRDFLVFSSSRLDGLRIALDCANGATYKVASEVFSLLGAETHAINANPNGKNINDGCGSTHIEPLSEFVIRNHMDMGFAFDGDGDRCIAVDEKGRAVDGDAILYIVASYLKNVGKLRENMAVITTESNGGLKPSLGRKGIKIHYSGPGDMNVWQTMKTTGSIIGGEQSGHMILGECEATGDGIVTALKLANIARETGKPLSVLWKDLKIYPQSHINVPVRGECSEMLDAIWDSMIENANSCTKEKFKLFVRPSGTEPVIRIMVESKSQKAADKVAQCVASHIEDALKRKEA